MRDPEAYRDYQRVYHAQRYRDDPEWQQRRKDANKRYRERRKLGLHQARVSVAGGSFPGRPRMMALAEYKLRRGCILCGFDEHYAALDFHHIDPATKSFYIARANSDSSRPPEEVVAEVSLCVIICTNCHRMLHVGVLALPPISDDYHDPDELLGLLQ